MTTKTRSKRQVRFLLSGVSPLKESHKNRLKNDIYSGNVKIKDKVKNKILSRKQTLQQIKKSIKKQTGYKG